MDVDGGWWMVDVRHRTIPYGAVPYWTGLRCIVRYGTVRGSPRRVLEAGKGGKGRDGGLRNWLDGRASSNIDDARIV